MAWPLVAGDLAAACRGDVGSRRQENAEQGTGLNRRSLIGAAVAFSSLALASPRPASAASTSVATDIEAYRAALAQLALGYRHALVDVRADWCPPCLHMEQRVFPEASVRALLDYVALIKVDVTAMDDANRRLLAHLRAEGPPTMFIVELASGREQDGTRSVGPTSRRALVRQLEPFARW